MATDNKIIMEKLATLTKRLDSVTEQLDTDRQDLDALRSDMSTVLLQQKQVMETMADFKGQIRDIVTETIKDEIKLAVDKKLDKIKLLNEKKVFVVYKSLFEPIRDFFHYGWRRLKGE
jgi:hypothetical protein